MDSRGHKLEGLLDDLEMQAEQTAGTLAPSSQMQGTTLEPGSAAQKTQPKPAALKTQPKPAAQEAQPKPPAQEAEHSDVQPTSAKVRFTDKYKKVNQIGSGSFGSAWLVKRKQDGAGVVAKEVKLAGVSSKEKMNILKEVEVMQKLSHENIVSLHEALEEGHSLYIIMELCDGGDLDKYIKGRRGSKIKEEKIVEMFAQICKGLHFMHSRRILHRDIKGANILLTKKGQVKLADFGVARVMSEDTHQAMTQIGTPYYISPEICEGKPYDGRSDVWSLGVVLYEMCTLKRPFVAGSLPALVVKIVRVKYEPIGPTEYSEGLRGLVSSCLVSKPGERASLDDLMSSEVLDNHLQGAGGGTEPQGSASSGGVSPASSQLGASAKVGTFTSTQLGSSADQMEVTEATQLYKPSSQDESEVMARQLAKLLK